MRRHFLLCPFYRSVQGRVDSVPMVTNSRIMHAVCVSYMEGVVMLSTIRDQRDATGRAQSAARNHCATTYHALSYALTPVPLTDSSSQAQAVQPSYPTPLRYNVGTKLRHTPHPSPGLPVCPALSLVSRLSLAHADRKAQPPTGAMQGGKARSHREACICWRP